VSLEQLLGKRIVQLREERKWTQEKLAAEADLNPRHLQQIEYGELWPRVATLRKLANAFKMAPEDILRGI